MIKFLVLDIFVLVFNNGIILQWGRRSGLANGSYVTTLPITYTNSYSVIAIMGAGGINDLSWCNAMQVINISLTNWTLWKAPGESTGLYWQSIGY